MLRLKTFGGLWIENEQAVVLGAVRPRRLALLAILGAAGTRGLSRDQVLAILWPESDLDRGRHALSQTLYSLRHDLGIDAVLTGAELRLDPARISADVTEFRAAIAAEDCQRAAALYVGPFLDGFYLSDAAEFERWTETERSQLARGGLRAIETTAAEAAKEGRSDLAAESWRRLTRLDPLSSRFATRYMEALAGLGERAAAMAHGQEHAAAAGAGNRPGPGSRPASGAPEGERSCGSRGDHSGTSHIAAGTLLCSRDRFNARFSFFRLSAGQRCPSRPRT